MAATLTVLYPSGSDFKMEYYMKSHMPLVAQLWGPEGLQRWNVSKIVSTATGGAAPYLVQCVIEWTSLEAVQKALAGSGTPKILADVPNFCDKDPLIIVGDGVGRS